MTDRRFSLVLGLAGFLVLLAIGTTNYHVDPFGIFERDLVTGFNDQNTIMGWSGSLFPTWWPNRAGKPLYSGTLAVEQ